MTYFCAGDWTALAATEASALPIGGVEGFTTTVLLEVTAESTQMKKINIDSKLTNDS